jgi:hypothetical protein
MPARRGCGSSCTARGVSATEVLPTPLRLRTESEDLAEAVRDMRSEEQVRAVVAELNERIMQWRKLPVGLPIFVALVDEDQVVAVWRQSRLPA